jgi:hypothetical protein
VNQGLSVAASRPDAAQFKALVVLTLGVLVAHIVVLQGTSVALSLNEPTMTRPFITRMVQITAPAVATEPAPVAASAVAPPAAARKKPARTTPALAQNSPSAPVEYAQEATKTIAPEPSAAASVATDTPAAANPAEARTPATVPGAPASDPSLAARVLAIPGSSRLKYEVTGGKDGLTYHARAELLWLHDGNTYDARMEVSAFLIGSRVRTSSGRMTAQGLAPTRFSDKTRGEQAAHFDRDKERITFSNGPEAPLLAGAQDQLSLFIQLGAMMAGEPGKYPAGTSISLQTVGPRAAETWVVTVEGEEKLQLPGGELKTLKLVRNPRREYDQKAELWLAPTLGYLPARLKLTLPNGDFVDQQWRESQAP